MFLVNQSSLGHALTRWETRALAARLGSSGEEVAPLGRKWLRAFLLRHPILRSRKYQRVEAKRLRAATKQNIGSWFNFMGLPIVKAIKPANRWNADEGGLMEGKLEKALTIGYSDGSELL
jgi:hypothetical protein